MEMRLKAGRKYLGIARVYVQPMAGGLRLVDTGAMSNFIRNEEYARIESVGKLEPIIRASVSVLRDSMKRELRLDLPAEYEEYVLHDAECEALKLNLHGLERQQAILAVMMDTMEALHDAWAKSAQVAFANGAGVISQSLILDDKFRRLFAPIQLLDWDILRRYYQMTVVLLGDLSPLPDASMVRDCCERRTKNFCRENDICDVETLQAKLMDGAKFYPILDEMAEMRLTQAQMALRTATLIMSKMPQV